MSISAIGGSYGSAYSYDNSTKKQTSGQDPLAAMIASFKNSDPTLSAKLQKISDDADSLRKSGASEKEVRESVHKAIDGLDASDKSQVQSAMGPRPSHKHGHGGPPPSDSSSDADASQSFDLASYLNSVSSSQNDAIANFLQTSSVASA